MYCFSSTFCFICLRVDDPYLLLDINISKIDNLLISQVLELCSISMKFCDDISQNRICLPCCEEVREYYKFNRFCAKNFMILKSFAAKLKARNERHGTLKVLLNDVNEYKDESSMNIKQDNDKYSDLQMDLLIVKEEKPEYLEDIPNEVKPEVVTEYFVDDVPNNDSSDEDWSYDNFSRKRRKIEHNTTNSEITESKLAFIDNDSNPVLSLVPTKNSENPVTEIIDLSDDMDNCSSISNSAEDDKQFPDIEIIDIVKDESIEEIEEEFKIGEPCKICKQKYSDDIKLSQHKILHKLERKNFKNSNYLCVICKVRLTGTKEIKSHIITHSGDKLYTCTTCDLDYLNYEYKTHLEKNPSHCEIVYSNDENDDTESGDKCDECNKYFSDPHIYSQHLLLHKLPNDNSFHFQYFCTTCQKTLISAKIIKIHIASHTNEILYSCTVCNIDYIDVNEYKKHMCKYPNHRPYKCTKCIQKFLTKNKFDEHLQWSHLYPCKYCKSKIHYPKFLLKEHILNEHSFRICHICCDTFSTEKMLMAHLKGCHQSQSHGCIECKQTFTDIVDLNNHYGECIIRNKNELYVIKTICKQNAEPVAKFNKRFSSANKLQQYLETEYNKLNNLQSNLPTLENNVRCNLCLTIFPNKKQLLTHIYEMHTNKKALLLAKICNNKESVRSLSSRKNRFEKLKCNICDKVFMDSDFLIRHLECEHYTSKDSLECNGCNQTFDDFYLLHVHLIDCSKKKIIICSFCDIDFYSAIAFISHFHIKHNESFPFTCKDCKEQFYDCLKLNQHMSETHIK